MNVMEEVGNTRYFSQYCEAAHKHRTMLNVFNIRTWWPEIWLQLQQSATVFGNITAANAAVHNDIIGGGAAGEGGGTHARL